jgi:gas vesicle protein
MAGAIIGGLVGATLALLYAPAEGSELRRTMGEKLDDVAEKAKEILRNAKTTAEKMFDEGRGNADEIIDSTRERANGILEDADRAIAEARRRAKEERDQDDDEA